MEASGAPAKRSSFLLELFLEKSSSNSGEQVSFYHPEVNTPASMLQEITGAYQDSHYLTSPSGIPQYSCGHKGYRIDVSKGLKGYFQAGNLTRILKLDVLMAIM